MNTESLWAGYCDGFRGDKFNPSEFDSAEYEIGYDAGKLDRSPIVLDVEDNSCFYEEYQNVSNIGTCII